MDIKDKFVELAVKSELNPAFILEGALKEYSTEALHYHSCHQFLKITTGITLLVEENKKQPLFSNMTAFIPASILHRSTVMGGKVNYKSLYLDENLFNTEVNEIVIFDMSTLGVALFDRIDISQKIDSISSKCLDLFLELIEEEIHLKSNLTRIPIPENHENKKITDYIESNFDKKLTLSEFTDVLHYSERHISRIFKEDLKISIFEYLKLYRIFKASLKLCENSSETITDIAFSCGYESLSSFYKDFREIFSLTPKVFKQNMKR
ncbi:MAG: helix-turn-helix transcriptional regulator [Desulfobacterales bacterium]|nr:helix-turn-helix transcriptional regulator [Desulfobacterales bacterium]MCP4163422.1 helix-turn-helix transcriptional regulator [Deltaproteobacteria bacterium]